MSIYVAPALTSLPFLEATPSSVTTFADELIAASTSLEQYEVLANEQKILADWQGDAAAAYGAYANRAADDAPTAARAMKEVARAADTYSAQLTTLSTERDALVEQRKSYTTDRNKHYAETRSYPLDDLELIERLEQQTIDLQNAYDSLDEATNTWLADLASADEDMNAVLAQYVSPSAAENAPAGASASSVADSALNRTNAPGSGASPDEVARWWDNLTDAERSALITEYPEIIGNTDGLPTDVRDRANRINLDADYNELEFESENGTLSFEQQKQWETAESVKNALAGRDSDGNPFPQFDAGGNAIDPPHTPPRDPITGKPVEAFLLVYKPEAYANDGGVAISMGDPTTADNVAVTVPGVNTEGGAAANGTRDAYNAYTSARFSDPNASTASIFWLDYDSPSSDNFLTDTPGQTMADRGAKNLNSFVLGLKENNPDSHYTAIGHSYGSMLVAQAGDDYTLPVDDFVLIGSPGPGQGIDHATDLGVPANRVFVGDASDDNVSKISDGSFIHGPDITREKFGAVRFEAETSGTKSLLPWDFAGHSRYFTPESESLNNIGQIIVGDRGEVTEAGYEYDKQAGNYAYKSTIYYDPETHRDGEVVERKPEW